MTRLAGIDIAAPPLLAIPILLGVLLVVAILLGRLVGRLTRRWLHIEGVATIPGVDDLRPAPRIGMPVTVAILTSGLLLLAPEFAALGGHARWARVGVTVLLVGSCAITVTRLAVWGVSVYTARHPTLSPATGVARMAVRIMIGILAVLTGLQSLGVPVTPLLTTLGIGSLAVALALQDTLANFFAGLYLLADRPVRPGDYIKLSESATEGYVDSIGWRSSRLRTLQGNTIIVPNQKLSQTILTNFNLPQPDMVLAVAVTVPYSADAAAVEGYLLDELKRAGRELPDLASPDPAVRLVHLGDAGMVFNCITRVRDFEGQGRASHEIRRRIVTRLKQEGITPATPHQIVRDASPGDRRAFNRND
jgi:small-conductance mechanosensitive channel